MPAPDPAPPPAPDPAPIPPLPEITDENRPFWAAAAAGQLRMQECLVCGHIRFPIQPLCPRCISGEFAWTTLSGRGEVFATVVYHRAFHPAYAARVPYNLVLVQLAEGPRMYSNVVGTPGAQVSVGDQLEVVFDPVSDEVHIPRFRRVTGGGPAGSGPSGGAGPAE
jgi:uncharacterized protein